MADPRFRGKKAATTGRIKISYVAEMIRSVVPASVGRLVRRIGVVLDPYGRLSYGQEGEDLVLLRLFERQRRGFFVDVGAHHPMRFSNTWLFYQRGWEGINLEPNPQAVQLFQKWRPRDVSLAMGIGEKAGTIRYFEFDEPALNTYDEQLAAQRQQRDGYRLAGVTLRDVRRLDDVLAEHLPAGRAIDFLSIDVEGLDLQVLRSNDWNRFRPGCLLIEALGSTVDSLASTETHRFVTQRSYVFYAKTGNTCVYLDRNRWPDLC